MRKKYLIRPGYVISQSDGQRHWIGPAQLMHLYGVRPAECVIEGTPSARGYSPTALVLLAPKSSGDYALPEVRNGAN